MNNLNILRMKCEPCLSPTIEISLRQDNNFSFSLSKFSIEESSLLEEQSEIFKNLNIFVEIFNNNTNQSDCVIPILQKNGAIINSKIKKTTDYIIFKDGRKNIIQKALDNNIKLISPLWIHDCTTKGILLDTEGYRIKKTYTELLFENKKRKYNDVVLNTTKSMGTPGKKRKLEKNKTNKEFVSPAVLNRESKVRSEIVPVKFVMKKDEDRKIPLKEIKNENRVEEDTAKKTNEVERKFPKSKSVFGENIRIFNEENNKLINRNKGMDHAISKQNSNLKRVINNKENVNKIPQTSVKIIRDRYHSTCNFTPINCKFKRLNLYSYNKTKEDAEDFLQKNKKEFDILTERINFSAKTENNIQIGRFKQNKMEDMKMSLIDKFDEVQCEESVILNEITNNKNSFNMNDTSRGLNNSKLIKNENSFYTTTTKIVNNHMSKQKILKNNFVSTEKKLLFSSINLNENNKEKIKSIIKSLQANKISKSLITTGTTSACARKDFIKNSSHTFLGDSIEDIIDSEYVVIKNSAIATIARDILCLYISLINNKKLDLNVEKKSDAFVDKKFIKFSYFTDCDKKKKFLPIENYLVKFPIDFLAIEEMKKENDMPLKSFKIFLHPSIYSENYLESPINVTKNISTETHDNYKVKTLNKIVQILGGDLVNHIRLCDLCVINKLDCSQYFPPHVKNLNTNFIFDTLENLKLPDLDHFKYNPKDGKYQKNRK